MLLRVAAMLMALAIPSFAGAAWRTVIDDLGFDVAVHSDSRRVVSLVPTNSELVCLLDCARLVGGTRYDRFPAELQSRMQSRQIVIVGGGFDANLETIVRLRPDLVLINGPTQQRFAVPLKNLGYPVLSLWPRDLAGLEKSFSLLAQLLAQPAKGQRLLQAMRHRFDAIEARGRNKPSRRAYLQMWTDPLITVGGESFPDWLLSAAGGVNVFNDMTFDSGPVSLEALIERDPEVLIFLAEHRPFAQTLAKRPGWSLIRGVRAGRFCFIEEADLRRSIAFLDGLSKIQRCLFPEIR